MENLEETTLREEVVETSESSDVVEYTGLNKTEDSNYKGPTSIMYWM